ncbi:hypothetical protein H4CHR_00004 [Variovorax sp. PBS-H4]|uniref:hypothetical protein n=1 Tax=Variovorax sp. PBS-H4 TaxID=434008 RepID=UPI001318E268|nr:hypothetical protein [Variovorax sp. PBS-H4]VTU17521.1 hypothetical protein H4CHR_00004 [Variovorax sp. PBS-H4]
MKPNRFGWALVAMVILGAGTSAQALPSNPPIQLTQGIEYMCGGRNSAEAAFMRMVSPRWAATLEFSVNRAKPGDVPDDVTVVVRERYTGRPIMEAVAGAPFMLARLDPGAYEVDATLGGVTLRQALTVFSGVASRAVFVWPSNVDFANAGGPRMAQQQAAVRGSSD